MEDIHISTIEFTEDQWLACIDQLAELDYAVIDNFISEALYHSLRACFKNILRHEEFDVAGIGAMQFHQVDHAIRGDEIYWLERDKDEGTETFFHLMGELVAKLNRYCFLSLHGYEFHLAHYPTGTFYKRHLDQFKQRNNRLISVILYLNENWQPGDGGELKLFLQEKEILIEPIGKKLVLLKSDIIEHEVLETKKSRYSLTGWLLHKPLGLGYLAG